MLKRASLSTRDHVLRFHRITATLFRGNDARRPLVEAALARLSRLGNFYRLFHLGCFSGKPLFRRQLHLPILFSRAFWGFPAQLVRPASTVVAGLVVVFARSADSLGAGRIPAHLLLLSRRLL